jgi:hypothetical protein
MFFIQIKPKDFDITPNSFMNTVKMNQLSIKNFKMTLKIDFLVW